MYVCIYIYIWARTCNHQDTKTLLPILPTQYYTHDYKKTALPIKIPTQCYPLTLKPTVISVTNVNNKI